MIQRAELRAKLIEEQLQREAQAQDEAGVRVDEHDAEISSKMERTMRKIYGAEPRNTMTSTQTHGEPGRELSITKSQSKHTAGFAPEVHEQMIQRAELRAKLIEEQLQREAQAQDETGVPVDEHNLSTQRACTGSCPMPTESQSPFAASCLIDYGESARGGGGGGGGVMDGAEAAGSVMADDAAVIVVGDAVPDTEPDGVAEAGDVVTVADGVATGTAIVVVGMTTGTTTATVGVCEIEVL
eukprot:TRINITY_DN8075_c1_g2_i3.p1 TRINITY_DN8075_c1_g2~~TRINITY_DN8075_c1_g2_i3.p1  ORF type:complete len:241 (-),score=62.16 TRINITY_DN8075_c1_g2_i3:168-890(-)